MWRRRRNVPLLTSEFAVIQFRHALKGKLIWPPCLCVQSRRKCCLICAVRFWCAHVRSENVRVRIERLPVLWRTIDTAADTTYSINSVFDLFFALRTLRISTPRCHIMPYWAHILSNEDKWLFSLNYTLHKNIEWKFVMRPYNDLLHDKPCRRSISFDFLSFSSCPAPRISPHTHARRQAFH